ncbi:hypothetical protein [Thalassospira xiamenensis]|uniref:Apea-like HEPN domain-containing protein n=1 Tax=Thalassospira xiamenensis TaxID=220697 RepID=A0A367XAX2_9PROT|nr:hypothetical protein [Thalassospira xiamenensis]KZB50807.1 hypothetical protein AUP41_09860 [Thalassospira xiamenensis]RCK49812.1 hypothetical protein TH44_14570 [Thalassospira xiamenensis]
MFTEIQIVEKILEELSIIQGLSVKEIVGDDQFILPRLIAAGEGKSIQINRQIDGLISKLALRLKRQEMAKSVRDRELVEWVRAKIGLYLVKVDFSFPQNVQAQFVLDNLRAELNTLLDSMKPSEFYFGSTFLNISKFNALSIGGVTIEDRGDWLSRMAENGHIDSISKLRIKRAWSGRKLKPRNDKLANILENRLLQALENKPYVFSVAVDGHAREAGKEQAIAASRLAMTGVSLLWRMPSQILTKCHLSHDRGPWTEFILASRESSPISYGIRKHGIQTGLKLSAEEWNNLLERNVSFLNAVSEVINFLLNNNSEIVNRGRLLNTLLQAMFWFYYACKEDNPTTAMVGFSAALDALSGGKKANGILAVLEARLGMSSSDIIYDQGPSLNEFVKYLYSQGRSRIVHGTSDKMGHDWSTTRGTAESLTRHALYACLDWVGGNRDEGYSSFLLKVS